MTEATLAGLITAGRLDGELFGEVAQTALLALRSPLETLLAMAASREDNARLRSEFQTLTDRLAGRTQIERAKGVMQSVTAGPKKKHTCICAVSAAKRASR